MEETKDLIQQRRDKLDEIRQFGVEPYPHKVRTYTYDIRNSPRFCRYPRDTRRNAYRSHRGQNYDKTRPRQKQLRTSPRWRRQIQIYVRRDKVGAEPYKIYRRFDSGDIVGAEGTVFRTRTGELTVLVDAIELLSKSIRPLPEKWHGLQDKQTRYRQRYADLIMNPEVKGRFS